MVFDKLHKILQAFLRVVIILSTCSKSTDNRLGLFWELKCKGETQSKKQTWKLDAEIGLYIVHCLVKKFSKLNCDKDLAWII